MEWDKDFALVSQKNRAETPADWISTIENNRSRETSITFFFRQDTLLEQHL